MRWPESLRRTLAVAVVTGLAIDCGARSSLDLPEVSSTGGGGAPTKTSTTKAAATTGSLTSAMASTASAVSGATTHATAVSAVATTNGVSAVSTGDCTPLGAACTQSSECCTMICSQMNGHCVEVPPCKPWGASCTQSSECCTGYCAGGMCGNLAAM